jgi:hypothetical protein
MLRGAKFLAGAGPYRHAAPQHIFAQFYTAQCTVSLVKLNTTHFNQFNFDSQYNFQINVDPEPEHIDAAPQPKTKILLIIIL